MWDNGKSFESSATRATRQPLAKYPKYSIRSICFHSKVAFVVSLAFEENLVSHPSFKLEHSAPLVLCRIRNEKIGAMMLPKIFGYIPVIELEMESPYKPQKSAWGLA